jgi:hypothetical protein
MIKIKAQRIGALGEQDRLQLAALLVKAGYAVRIGREKAATTSKTSRYEYFVEAREGSGSDEQNQD